MDIRHNPWLGIKLLRESHLETLNVFASRMEVAMKEVHSALTRAADDMAHFYDAHQKEAPCSWRQSLAQWVEHHYDSSDEEIRPQVAGSIPQQTRSYVRVFSQRSKSYSEMVVGRLP